MDNNTSPLQQGLALGEVVSDKPPDCLSILPGWEDAGGSMVLPNCLVRSGLFSISKSSGNILLKRKVIPSAAGINIVYTGPILVQSDFDVWYGLLSLSKTQHGKEFVEFGTKPLLVMLGRSTGKTDREWLKNSIAKLSATTVEVNYGDLTYGGSLVDEFFRDEATGRYAVKLNKKLACLFAPDSWSLINFEERSRLRHKPLAQWLHAFYSTHRNPLDYGVEKIMHICGSESKETFDFRQRLRDALKAVSEVTGWCCCVNGDSDTVSIRKDVQKLEDAPLASELFMAFWGAYHQRKRVNFAQTREMWKTLDLDGQAKEVMEGLERWNKSMDWHTSEGQWIPSPDKWLEKKRWLDEPAPFKVSLVKDRAGRAVTHEHGDVDRDYGANGSF